MSQKSKAGRSQSAASEKKMAKAQSERFIETARALGVDESGKEFEMALRKIVPRAKPKRRS
jgi:ABC-type dipeptide/oligopeptide/nickel transport system permease component